MSVLEKERSATGTGWELEFARLVAFPTTPPVFMEQNWWQELVGGRPDDFLSTRKKLAREDRGAFRGRILTLRIDTARIEWRVQPADTEEPGGEFAAFATIGPFREKIAWFVESLIPWLEKLCPPMMRLAFTGKLLQPAATQSEAYRVLSQHLPGVNFDGVPNDFLLQINRRRTSSVVPGLPVNRVSSWSKLNVGLVTDAQTRTYTFPDRCYSAVELDINTAPERVEPLPRESLAALFEELAALGVEIAERGDVP